MGLPSSLDVRLRAGFGKRNRPRRRTRSKEQAKAANYVLAVDTGEDMFARAGVRSNRQDALYVLGTKGSSSTACSWNRGQRGRRVPFRTARTAMS